MDINEKIAGEITISETPGITIKKWREEFGISQMELSKFMEVSPSVISDYESGRRKSPGLRGCALIAIIGLLPYDTSVIKIIL